MAKVEVPAFDSIREAFFNVQGKVESGNSVTVKRDGKEYTEEYLSYEVTNRAQALALLGGDDSKIWAVISDWFTARAKRNATSNATAKANGPERQMATGVYKLLTCGLPQGRDMAIAAVVRGLGKSNEDAETFVNEVERKYDEAKAKRDAAKAA